MRPSDAAIAHQLYRSGYTDAEAWALITRIDDGGIIADDRWAYDDACERLAEDEGDEDGDLREAA